MHKQETIYADGHRRCARTAVGRPYRGGEESTGEDGGGAGQHQSVTLATPHTCTTPDLT